MRRSPIRRLLCHALAAGLFGAAYPALAADESRAQEPEAQDAPDAEQEQPIHPRVRLTYANLLGGRLNPQGLSDKLDLGLKIRLYDSGHVVLRDAYAGLRVTPQVTPQFSGVTTAVEFKPLSLLLLSAGYRFKGWYGVSGSLMSFASPNDDHSDTELDRREEREEHFATVGRELDLQAQLLAKIGPVAMRNDLHALRFETVLRDRGRLHYHLTLDTLMADGGWAITNDTDLVFLTDFGLVAGARSHITHVPYSDDLYASGTGTDNPNTPIYRVGPLLAYVFYDDPEALINKPTVIGIFNWYLAHRFRTGADTSQALPYIALAFRVEGDLWKSE